MVVGGGIVGLAVARELLLRRPGLELIVLEREPRLAAHQSGRNSGVIHSGVYYTPGTLRARTCVLGGRLLEEFCAERGVPLLRCGKVIVATSVAELPRLEEIHRRGLANRVAELHRVDAGGLAEIEPHVHGVAALHLPRVAAVDFAAVTRELAADVTERGGQVRLGHAAIGLAEARGGALVGTAGGSLAAAAVVVCAGLWADRLAVAAGAPPRPRIVPFRGGYRRLAPERAELVRGMVYPVPDPALPFLGVHATRRVDGAVWLGPTAVLALRRDGYRRGAVGWGDAAEMARDPDLLALLGHHWRAGLGELARDRSAALLARSLRRLLPELSTADLRPGPCGIRAQALGRGGRLLDDFVTWRRGPILCVRNAPSPAATAALAIARLVADQLEA